jgi:hypothetical protein
VQTQHFMLYTDLDRESASEQGRRLERLLFALQETAWEATGDLPLTLNVIMFADPLDFERYTDGTIFGYAVQEELFAPWIVLSAPRRGDDYAAVAHEVTHGMASQAIAHLPSWTSEGLASYFESAHFHSDGSFQIGVVPKGRFESLLQLGWDRPSQLIARSGGAIDLRFYGSSWLFVHYLMTRQSDAFVAFQDHLARGMSELDAWQRAFPDLSMRALDQAVMDYARAGVYESYVFELAPPDEPWVSVRPLQAADEHVLLALLWKHCDSCTEQERGRARLELETALSLDPTNVWATTLSIQQHLEADDRAFERARDLVRVHSDHWMAWLALGVTAFKTDHLAEVCRDPETDPGLRAVGLAPRQPYALMMSALTAIQRGERERAIRDATAAQRLQPTNTSLLWQHAELLAGLSACGELRASITRIEQNAHKPLAPKLLLDLRERAENCREPVESGWQAKPEATP